MSFSHVFLYFKGIPCTVDHFLEVFINGKSVFLNDRDITIAGLRKKIENSTVVIKLDYPKYKILQDHSIDVSQWGNYILFTLDMEKEKFKVDSFTSPCYSFDRPSPKELKDYLDWKLISPEEYESILKLVLEETVVTSTRAMEEKPTSPVSLQAKMKPVVTTKDIFVTLTDCDPLTLTVGSQSYELRRKLQNESCKVKFTLTVNKKAVQGDGEDEDGSHLTIKQDGREIHNLLFLFNAGTNFRVRQAHQRNVDGLKNNEGESAFVVEQQDSEDTAFNKIQKPMRNCRVTFVDIFDAVDYEHPMSLYVNDILFKTLKKVDHDVFWLHKELEECDQLRIRVEFTRIGVDEVKTFATKDGYEIKVALQDDGKSLDWSQKTTEYLVTRLFENGKIKRVIR